MLTFGREFSECLMRLNCRKNSLLDCIDKVCVHSMHIASDFYKVSHFVRRYPVERRARFGTWLFCIKQAKTKYIFWDWLCRTHAAGDGGVFRWPYNGHRTFLSSRFLEIQCSLDHVYCWSILLFSPRVLHTGLLDRCDSGETVPISYYESLKPKGQHLIHSLSPFRKTSKVLNGDNTASSK